MDVSGVVPSNVQSADTYRRHRIVRYFSRRARLTAAIATLVAAVIGGAATAFAQNPDSQVHSYNGTCQIATTSSFAYSPSNFAYSNTIKYSGYSCASDYDVHAYFWGSDYQWYYFEQIAGSPGAQVEFPWWTNNIYGYHKHPSTSSTTWNTHAY